MLARDVQQYLDDTASVEGWFFPVDAYLFGVVDEVQRDNGVAGNLYEIGVHHGKTALLLARMLRTNEHLGVCDVFGQQDLNVDHSGDGSLPVFLANLHRHTSVSKEDISIHAKRSEYLTSAETTTACRIFHIDGGHRPQDVRADIETGVHALHPAGMIVVDDVFNESWPGVAEGFFEYMLGHSNVLTPVFIGGNKVYLAKESATEIYETARDQLTAIGEVLPFTFESKEWFGRSVMTAVRHHWVDLDPLAAAMAHLGPQSRTTRGVAWLLRRLLR